MFNEQAKQPVEAINGAAKEPATDMRASVRLRQAYNPDQERAAVEPPRVTGEREGQSGLEGPICFI